MRVCLVDRFSISHHNINSWAVTPRSISNMFPNTWDILYVFFMPLTSFIYLCIYHNHLSFTFGYVFIVFSSGTSVWFSFYSNLKFLLFPPISVQKLYRTRFARINKGINLIAQFPHYHSGEIYCLFWWNFEITWSRVILYRTANFSTETYRMVFTIGNSRVSNLNNLANSDDINYRSHLISSSHYCALLCHAAPLVM